MRLLTRRANLLAMSTSLLFASSAHAEIPRVFRAPAASMEPTIMEGEYFQALPILDASNLTPGEIVVFRHDDRQYVKRIMAFAGDRISFRGAVPTVNSVAAEWTEQPRRGAFRTFRETMHGRSYLVELGNGTSQVRDVAESVVPAGQLYVVGDSRDRSFDSRVSVFGAVTLGAVSHKAVAILQSDDPSRVNRVIE